MEDSGPRYADCPSVEVDVLVDAPASAVWALVSDINTPARFSGEFQGARWLDGASGPAVGARFAGRNEHPAAGSWETTCTVVEYEPHQRFGYVVGDPEQPAAAWRFTLEPEDASTRLRQWAQMRPAPSPLSKAIEARPEKERRIVARRLEELRGNMTATVNGIKELAERSGAGTP